MQDWTLQDWTMTDGTVLIIFPTLPQATTIAELHLMEERRVDKVEDLEHTIWQPFWRREA